MGFWDTVGKAVGTVVGATYENIVETNEKVRKYSDEMEDYSEEELREIVNDSWERDEKRTAAMKLLNENYR